MIKLDILCNIEEEVSVKKIREALKYLSSEENKSLILDKVLCILYLGGVEKGGENMILKFNEAGRIFGKIKIGQISDTTIYVDPTIDEEHHYIFNGEKEKVGEVFFIENL